MAINASASAARMACLSTNVGIVVGPVVNTLSTAFVNKVWASRWPS
jgi:hypothetical protein